MELNFKNILLESIIDELESLSKMDKAVLKFIHNSMGRENSNTLLVIKHEMDG